MKEWKQGSKENRAMRLRCAIKTLIELSQGDDYIFLMNKFNSIMIDGKQYTIKLQKCD